MRTRLLISLLPVIAASASPAFGQSFEDVGAIDRRAAELAATLGKQAAPVDRRIKLPRCPEVAVIETVDAHSLAARCMPLGWRLRIALSPTPGAVLADHTPAAPIVKRGDHLRLRVQRDGFVLVYDVVAAAGGRAGDVIPVRAEGSKTVLQARLLGPGQATLND